MSNESLFDKAKDFLKGHPDKVAQGTERAEHLINEHTGGKYSEQVAEGGDRVRHEVGVADQPQGATVPTPDTDPDVSPGSTPDVPPPPQAPDPATVPTPVEPATQPPPAPSPDPVPTTSPEPVPEASPSSMPGATPDTPRNPDQGA
jgi:hypothetical protein